MSNLSTPAVTPASAEPTIYQRQGYANRREYLECLAEEYGHSKDDVFALASALGPSEDFDGLVTTLEEGF
ncbi:hypothetical protein [Marinimicrobium sp. ABcell2]|uniref:hypothetical protein n=1 Tax=Marinimicrobium sp. ABcell2 TaxID=3069751 RepID=UPI0027AE925A|nr:hypothetical protein [Marinimicrobium sp. ABcell2]MDQ2077420.1 hypothetical protein [Marinimicrobium sp. ABcell2]